MQPEPPALNDARLESSRFESSRFEASRLESSRLEASRFEAQPLSAGRIAERVSLSQGTVTLILDKLESRGLVSRARDEGDRRKVLVTLTAGGRRVLESAPPLMQAQFIRRFENLSAEQREELVHSLERIAELMHSPEDAGLTPVA